MKSGAISNHFQTLQQQREAFYKDANLDFDHAWTRPLPEKWSIGETVYHLFLLARLLRRFSDVYVPMMLPIATIKKNKPYKTKIHNIYAEFQLNQKRSMKAPFLLNSPSNLQEKLTFEEIQKALEGETEKLKIKFSKLDENIAGHIIYPDPVAYYPNVIQSVQLLAIHEQHHFELVKKYFAK